MRRKSAELSAAPIRAVTVILVLCGAAVGAASGAPRPRAQTEDTVEIGGQSYRKLESRRATEQRMLDLLSPPAGTWGAWHLLGPFPYAGAGNDDLAAVLEPESEMMARLGPGGPGPDLTRVYTGKNGVEARWIELEGDASRFVDLVRSHDQELNEKAVVYAWNTVTTDVDRVCEVRMGTDDGVRVWVNGRLMIDKDVERGMDPGEDLLRLDLHAGVNHVLLKVAQGLGSWSFQVATRPALAPDLDALLYYYLDRDFPPSPERNHYEVFTLPVPPGLELEVGGLAFLGDGRPIVATRRGDVLVVEGAYDAPPRTARYLPFASGLHEILGLNVRRDPDGEAVYATQRGELTRLRDEDGDGVADLYEAFCTDWKVSGNYHEFAFGPEWDAEGNAWVTLNVGFCGSLGKALVPWRGAALKIDREGNATWVCDGLRSPNGIGRFTDGTMFYVDNQGDYVATNKLAELKPGSWHGHPASLRWRTDLSGPDDRPARQPPAVWFPYEKMGQSAADLALDQTGGRFGPFEGQFFVGDQLAACVMRVSLEKVNGHWQGACYPFLEDLACGVNRVEFAADGSMFVGETDRGWTSVGRNRFGLERIVYRGVTPFEILAMNARQDGFDLTFTRDVDPASAADAASYAVTSYTYEYHAEYGAPETDKGKLPVVRAEVKGPRTVHLQLAQLRPGYVHELSAAGVRDVEGEPLLHAAAYYTLIEAPGQPSARAADAKRKRVLFFTHAAGFRHPVVTRAEPDHLSFAELRLQDAAAGRFDVTCTQDCAAIDAENLAKYDAVVFYTSGELPIDAQHRAALFDWIRRGGAFIGVHSATDTWYDVPEYRDLIGGAFNGHPWVQKAGIRVEDPHHPAVASLAPRFEIEDEMYTFRDFEREPLHVLLSLDTSSVDLSKGNRDDGDYALCWWKDQGEGRMFYTALGHGEGTWRDRRFLDLLLKGIRFAIEGPDVAAPPPQDAVVLIDGEGRLQPDRMVHRDGAAPRWETKGGGLEVTGGGDLRSLERFGDGLYHVEFQLPALPADVQGQARANSGVYVAGRYEIQVLDSYGLAPGPGDCAAIYAKHAPSTNAARKPGRWQSYDIRFHAPRFDADGKKTANARFSVWWNGLKVHDEADVDGPTGGAFEEGEGSDGALLLQDHGNPVRYRNVWFRAFSSPDR